MKDGGPAPALDFQASKDYSVVQYGKGSKAERARLTSPGRKTGFEIIL
jgi:hypothetical protein